MKQKKTGGKYVFKLIKGIYLKGSARQHLWKKFWTQQGKAIFYHTAMYCSTKSPGHQNEKRKIISNDDIWKK